MLTDQEKFDVLIFRLELLLMRLGCKRYARMRIVHVLCWWLLLPTRWIGWVLDIPRRRQMAEGERVLRAAGYWSRDDPGYPKPVPCSCAEPCRQECEQWNARKAG